MCARAKHGIISVLGFGQSAALDIAKILFKLRKRLVVGVAAFYKREDLVAYRRKRQIAAFGTADGHTVIKRNIFYAALTDRIEYTHTVDLVTEKVDTAGVLRRWRKHIQNTAAA
ncbi:unknown [Ruminococcus sp. CAG:382]|nr:unknown [Ruminococcus sp. CAG:382]